MKDRTKNELADAYLKLLSSQPLSCITIQNIVDNAGYSRKTFYYYFSDIYDLTDWVLNREIQSFLQRRSSIQTLHSGMLELARFMTEHRKLLTNAYNSYGSAMIAKGIQSALSSYITDAIDLQLAGRPCDPESKQLLVKLYIYGLYGFIIEWINGDMEGDFQQTSGRIMDMCEKLLSVYMDTMLTDGESASSD
jgi:AcrR family transcriptional regulator